MLDFSINLNVVDIVINLLVAITTAVITARISLKHFYRQEIWLRKETRYTELIDKLCTLLHYYEKQLEIAVGAISPDSINDLGEEYDKARTELERIRYSTGFIINPEVNKIIDNMIKDFELKGKDEKQGDYYSYTDRVYGVIKEAKDKIINIAKKDLKG